MPHCYCEASYIVRLNLPTCGQISEQSFIAIELRILVQSSDIAHPVKSIALPILFRDTLIKTKLQKQPRAIAGQAVRIMLKDDINHVPPSIIQIRRKYAELGIRAIGRARYKLGIAAWAGPRCLSCLIDHLHLQIRLLQPRSQLYKAFVKAGFSNRDDRALEILCKIHNSCKAHSDSPRIRRRRTKHALTGARHASHKRRKSFTQ